MEEDLNVLITRARDGDEGAFADLVVRYKPLLDSMARSYKKRCPNEMYSKDDFFQESTLALYSAVMTYKESDSVTFGLYAKICVKNRLVSLLRYASKKRQKAHVQKQNESDPVQRLLENEDSREIEKKVRSVLSDFEWSVFSLYIRNKSYAQIADALNRPEKSIDNAVYRIRTKLKKKM